MSENNSTIKHSLNQAFTLLSASQPDTDARLEAEILLAHVLNKDRSYFHTWPDRQLSTTESRDFFRLITQRSEGKPIAYLTEQKEFWSLALKINHHTLIPRPETELLIEITLKLIHNLSRPRILDLATGSGAIAIALAKERPDALIIASDVCSNALAVTEHNVDKHKINNVQIQNSDWLTGINSREFNLIVSNPPYLHSADPHFQLGDLRFEPKLALDGGADGLAAIKNICCQAKNYLVEAGYLVMEHGYTQRQAVLKLLKQNNYQHLSFFNDINGIPRAVLAQC